MNATALIIGRRHTNFFTCISSIIFLLITIVLFTHLHVVYVKKLVSVKFFENYGWHKRNPVRDETEKRVQQTYVKQTGFRRHNSLYYGSMLPYFVVIFLGHILLFSKDPPPLYSDSLTGTGFQMGQTLLTNKLEAVCKLRSTSGSFISSSNCSNSRSALLKLLRLS